MATNLRNIDVESPRPLELFFAPFTKDEEPSVATHYSDSDSDFQPSSHSRARYATPLRKLALVAIVATLLGVSAGFTARRLGDSNTTQSVTNPVSSETPSMETVVASEEGHRAGASVSAEYILNTYPQTSQTTPVYSLTSPQSNFGYNTRVEDPTAATTTGVLTTPPVQTAAPNETTKPPFSGTVGMGTPTQPLGWPQLVGLPGDQAKKIIEDEGKGYTVIIVPPGGVTTKDWRQDRVFLYVNEQGYVASIPYPGR